MHVWPTYASSRAPPPSRTPPRAPPPSRTSPFLGKNQNPPPSRTPPLLGKNRAPPPSRTPPLLGKNRRRICRNLSSADERRRSLPSRTWNLSSADGRRRSLPSRTTALSSADERRRSLSSRWTMILCSSPPRRVLSREEIFQRKNRVSCREKQIVIVFPRRMLLRNPEARTSGLRRTPETRIAGLRRNPKSKISGEPSPSATGLGEHHPVPKQHHPRGGGPLDRPAAAQRPPRSTNTTVT